MFTIRPAISADVPGILQLIGELADYEKLRDQMVATGEQLAEHLFGPHPVAEVLIAEVGGELAGFALYFKTFSTFVGKPGLYLEDLFVRPPFRRMGIGKSFFAELTKIVETRGYGRLEWSVLDWNKPALDFYETFGAHPMSEWTTMRLTR